MPISSKRRYSEREATESGIPLKKRSFILSNHAATPRNGSSLSCFSSGSEDGEYEKRNHLFSFDGAGGVLNPELVEAVSKYSDSDTTMKSDKDYNYQTGDASLRRKSLSRPGSFSYSSRKSQAPRSDLVARERCFDYIVQSIDEVWARYCDTTSSAEAVVYNNFGAKTQTGVKIPISQPHKSLNISETESDNCTIAGTEEADAEDDDESSGYKSEATNPTEYETDHGENRTVSNLPDSIKLQSLKHRLTKAKNDLELVYDSKLLEGSASFWRRWDMIKYSAVEMMEDDDDDDVIENAIEELEQGRCHTC
ncbi:hypothetical protein HG537_0B00290 [Torulaspora globosa]|uniref:Uncharacterized protein n=1 Tax=Torulaspora globosa TaxID=48254 RepID=A0A7H9HN42_9SACH|nr:hypothetical protein HG537_0B00290 [Torulaspora sp. CBS 2947]